jgi:hypothetical protein
MHSTPGRRTAGRFLAIAVVTASTLALPQTSAFAADPASCGNWWPHDGTLSGRHIPSNPSKTFNEFVLRTTFTFTPQEIDALRCTGSRSLEVDVETFGGMDGGLKGMDSNLPGAYIDTEAEDSKGPDGDRSRTLTIGSQRAADLVPNVEYHAELTLTEFGIKDNKNYAELYLNFQRGHWASSIPERGFCTLHGGGPANCIFRDPPDQLMASELGTPPRIEFSSYPVLASASWGNYRRTELRPGDRINSGDQIYSPDGHNRLVMQADGNLVEYDSDGDTLWASETSVPESILIAQADGNLVVVAPGNRPVWSSGVRSDDVVYQLQNDRNFVGYTTGHQAVWETATA